MLYQLMKGATPEEMKEAGLDVPLVIFDRFSIKEKMKDDKLEQKQNEDERF